MTQIIIETLRSHLSSELQRGDIDRVLASDEVDIITVVCPGLITTPGVAGQISASWVARGLSVGDILWRIRCLDQPDRLRQGYPNSHPRAAYPGAEPFLIHWKIKGVVNNSIRELLTTCAIMAV